MPVRRKSGAQEPATDWERLLKTPVIAFEVEKLSARLQRARWLASRDPKAHNAYTYRLPKK
jgi:hypothetical protein